jgi:hypothetical protein
MGPGGPQAGRRHGAAFDVNAEARLAGLRSALAVLALIALLGLFATRRIPARLHDPPPG